MERSYGMHEQKQITKKTAELFQRISKLRKTSSMESKQANSLLTNLQLGNLCYIKNYSKQLYKKQN